MNIIEKLFYRQVKFTILLYPRTKKYVVQYRSGWLKKEYNNGIVRIETLFDVVTFSDTEEQARELISLYKEQRFQRGVIVVDDMY